MELLLNETFTAILLCEDLLEFARDQSWDTLKFGEAQRPQIAAQVAVVVCAAPDAGFRIRFTFLENREIDVHARRHINPPRVDDVHPVDLRIVVMRVDIEEVLCLHKFVVLSVFVGNGIVPWMFCSVEVVSHELHGVRRYLHIKIKIPWHDPAIPPPAQQGAVRNPGLITLDFEEIEVGGDQTTKDVSVAYIGHLLAGEVSGIVVDQGLGARLLMEVLGVLLLLFFAGVE